MGEGNEGGETREGQSVRPRPWRSSIPPPPPPAGWRRIWRDERFSTLVGAIVVGVVGGAAAIAFRLLVSASWRLFSWVRSLDTAVLVAASLLLPALGGLAVGMLSRGEPRAPGDHGMVGIKEAFITSGGVLRTRIAAVRAIACAITTGSGGSAGCEGPIARVGGAVGSWLAVHLGLHQSRLQVLVACGVSASLAGLFHTPIAAVVFATEVVLGGYAIRSLAPLVVSSATATVVARAAFGKEAAFTVPTFVLQGPMDLIVHLAIGVLCGLAAAGFIHLLDRCQAIKTRIPAPVQPALGGLAVGAIALGAPGVVGVGYPSLHALFRGDMTLWVVVALLVGKWGATTLTLGSRGAGGVFAPSLLIGGLVGWLAGHGANHAYPNTFAPTGSFAAAGMVAMVAAVTQAPFTGAVLLVETSRSYQAVLPGVVAAVAASMVSSAIRDESAYAMVLSKRGLREPSERKSHALTGSTIRSLIDAVKDTVPASLPASELVRRLPSARSEVLIVAREGEVLGVLSVRQLRRNRPAYEEGSDVTALMVDTGTLRDSDSVARALVQFMRHDAPAMPVLDEAGALSGLVWRSDLMDFCAHDLLRDYLLLGAAALPSVCESDGRPLSHDVAAMPVPRGMVGRTLRDVDLGKQFGVVCVGLRRATPAGSFAPVHLSPRITLRADDVLIVTGNAPDLERLSRLSDDGAPGGPVVR